MKKIVLSLAVLVMGVAAQAQEGGFGFNQGDVLLEGNIQVNSTKESGETNGFTATQKQNNTNFSPKAGYFINDKFALGVQLGVFSGKETTTLPTGTNEVKQNGFYAGVFGRYYFLDLGQRFKTYTELGLGMNNYKEETNGTETQKNSGFSTGLGLGINYFVTPKIAINFGLSDVLSFSTSKDKNTDVKTDEFNANVNVFNNFFDTATFGLTFKL